MIPTIALRKALLDPLLLGTALAGDSWAAWRTLLLAAMGEALTDEERQIFKQLTGREREPNTRVEEFVGVIGRRGGKSRAISVLSTYIAGLCKHPNLVPGEKGTLLIFAPDQTQADIVLDHIEANFQQSPILRQLIEQRTARELKLTNRIDISVRAASYRNLRGISCIAAIADECGFFYNAETGSSNPDTEIINAVRPSLATTGGPLFMISSPYARRGELWNAYNKHFGPNGDPLILVAQASSRTMNPSLPQSVVDRAYERDPASAAAEYGRDTPPGAQFRTDIENFVSIEAVRACVATGVYERMPQPGISYVGFADPSGGSSDSFTCGIAHVDFTRDLTVIDALYERKPPLSPEAVVEEISAFLKRYNVITIVGDKYASIWPVEQFSKFGIVYEQSAAPKSDLYTNMLPMLNSTRIELLDNQRLVNQLVSLERRNTRGGRPTIDHPPGAHDDLANVVAGLVAINSKYGNYDSSFRGWSDDPNVNREAEAARYQRSRLAGRLFDLSGGRIWPG